MRAAAALSLLVLSLAGCVTATHTSEVSPAANTQDSTGEATALVLLRYKPPEQGGPTAFPEAHIHGVLDFSGPCVRLRYNEGLVASVVTSGSERLMRDATGVYWPSNNARLRHGSLVEGGGGGQDSLPLDHQLSVAVPDGCRVGRVIVLVGLGPWNPAASPPPRSPPPPPGR